MLLNLCKLNVKITINILKLYATNLKSYPIVITNTFFCIYDISLPRIADAIDL